MSGVSDLVDYSEEATSSASGPLVASRESRPVSPSGGEISAPTDASECLNDEGIQVTASSPVAENQQPVDSICQPEANCMVSTRAQVAQSSSLPFRQSEANRPTTSPIMDDPNDSSDSSASGMSDDNQIFDRDTPVVVPSINRSFPAPSEYDSLDTQHSDPTTMKTLGLSPWFDKAAVKADGDHFSRYCDENGFLPGQIHVDCLSSWCWQRIFCAHNTELSVPNNRLPTSIREDFVEACYNGLNRLFRVDPIPENISVDMFVYRTRGEIPYVENLLNIPDATIEGWRDMVGVRQAAICIPKPLLRVEFRYLTRRSKFSLEYIADERFARSLWNLAVPYHCPQAFTMNRDARRRGFCRFPDGWKRYEVAQGCLVELPPAVSYIPSRLMNRHSGYWVVMYTDFVCRTAARVLSDVYDCLRLWWISPATIAACRALDLTSVLGSQANVDELLELLNVIENTDFEYRPAAQSLRYSVGSHCLGRTGDGADFIYYDPWSRRRLSFWQYENLRLQGRKQMPAGHPVGFDFDISLPGWDGRVYTPTEEERTGPQPEVTPVDFLGIQAEYDAKPGLYFEEEFDETREPGYFSQRDAPRSAGPAPMSVSPTADHSSGGRGGHSRRNITDESSSDATVVRRFLREVGLSEASTSGTWSDMLHYMRGRLGL